MSDQSAERPSVFRPGGITYLELPAPDPPALGAFYAEVFGWHVDEDRAEPGFEDATGHVIGHFLRDLAVAGDAGARPYVYVDDVDETLAAVARCGGGTVTPPYAEGNLRVARLRDPAGNVLGVWQRGGAAAAG